MHEQRGVQVAAAGRAARMQAEHEGACQAAHLAAHRRDLTLGLREARPRGPTGSLSLPAGAASAGRGRVTAQVNRLAGTGACSGYVLGTACGWLAATAAGRW